MLLEPARSTLILFDLENTLQDWVSYFVPAQEALLSELSLGTGIPAGRVRSELGTLVNSTADSTMRMHMHMVCCAPNYGLSDSY